MHIFLLFTVFQWERNKEERQIERKKERSLSKCCLFVIHLKVNVNELPVHLSRTLMKSPRAAALFHCQTHRHKLGKLCFS